MEYDWNDFTDTELDFIDTELENTNIELELIDNNECTCGAKHTSNPNYHLKYCSKNRSFYER